MAMQDFKKHLSNVHRQYLEAKADLADFDEALKNGFISEDRVQQVKDDFMRIDENYQRLLYVDFLLNMPSRRQKKYLRRKKNKDKINAMKANKSDALSVEAESEALKNKLHAELENLAEKNKR